MPAGEKKARKPRAKKGDDAKKGGEKLEEKVKEEKEDPKKSDKKLSMLSFGKILNIEDIRSHTMLDIGWVFRLESEDNESTLVPSRPFSTLRESICVGANKVACLIPAKP